MADQHPDTEHDEPPAPQTSLWPLGFAIGVACLLVGLVVSLVAVVIGVVLTIVFGFLWVRELGNWGGAEAHAVAKEEAAPEPHHETYDRGGFITAATVGVGAAIGAAVTLPVLGFAVLPSFTREAIETFEVDLGPLDLYPKDEWVVATYMTNPEWGEVSRRTTYVRNNGFKEGEPSFTLLFSNCVHLGCPVQPGGLLLEEEKSSYEDVTLIPAIPANFGCPCHGGAYDTEGNRTAGPPVRALDRFEYSIKDGHLVLGRLYSVSEVAGTGANARITKYRHQFPGTPVDGWQSWLYPIPTPGS